MAAFPWSKGQGALMAHEWPELSRENTTSNLILARCLSVLEDPTPSAKGGNQEKILFFFFLEPSRPLSKNCHSSCI